MKLGAPRSELAKKLDSHSLGNVPDFLRQVRSHNVRGGVMVSRTSREKEFLPAIVQPRRSAAEVTEIIRRKRGERRRAKRAAHSGESVDEGNA